MIVTADIALEQGSGMPSALSALSVMRAGDAPGRGAKRQAPKGLQLMFAKRR